MSQKGILVPPDGVKAAFEKQYPKKNPVWSIEYGNSDMDTRFEAQFKTTGKAIGYALYDQNGTFKSYRELIPYAKLTKEAQVYLDANYPIKAAGKSGPKSKKSKSKAKPASPARIVYSIVNAQNITKYAVAIKKDKKNYNAMFDQDGKFLKLIEIQ